LAGPLLSGILERIAREAGAEAIAVAYHDYRTRTEWSFNGDESFHAASTMKVAVLIAISCAIAEGRFEPESRVHVRNRFLSAADGTPFRIDAGRDADAQVHTRVGRTMRIRDLAHHMIVTSSNLATNLLVDLVGLDEIQHALREMGLDSGIEVHRGVEDDHAFEQGISNRVTARGLLQAFRLIEERRACSAAASEWMLEELSAQEFNSGIPAGLPSEARVAHKTGEISTIAHDAGVVYLPGREPYVLVVLTRWAPERGRRQETIARLAGAVHEYLTAAEEAGASPPSPGTAAERSYAMEAAPDPGGGQRGLEATSHG
jgi:beta-lactamase class A